MPHPDAFKNTNAYTDYGKLLLHPGARTDALVKRSQPPEPHLGKKLGDDNYAAEELTAELGAAFLCAELVINAAEKSDHASYIAFVWRYSRTTSNACLLQREASRAAGYLEELQLA